MKSNRIGLSEYTARRLAELKARRAEADDTGAFLSSSTAAATEASVNDSYVASPSPPAIATQRPPTGSSSSADCNSTGGTGSSTVLPAAQLPCKNDSHSTSHSSTATSSHSTSTPAVTVSNGVSDGSLSTADTTSRQKQLLNDKPESNPSKEQQRIDKQDFSNTQAVTERSKLAFQHREMVPHPSQFMRSVPHSNNPTTISGSAVEVGALSKMASFFCIVSQYIYCLAF